MYLLCSIKIYLHYIVLVFVCIMNLNNFVFPGFFFAIQIYKYIFVYYFVNKHTYWCNDLIRENVYYSLCYIRTLWQDNCLWDTRVYNIWFVGSNGNLRNYAVSPERDSNTIIHKRLNELFYTKFIQETRELIFKTIKSNGGKVNYNM